MKLLYGIQSEAFKLTLGSEWIYRFETIADYPKSARLTAGLNDTAAFQLILGSDEAYSLNVGKAMFVSQQINRTTLRIEANVPFKTELNIIDMHYDDDRYLKADALLSQSVKEIDAGMAQSVWIEMKIPEDTKPGNYKGMVRILQSSLLKDETEVGCAPIDIEVIGTRIPSASEGKFYLDLWQHLSNIARKHEVELWSDAHFDVLDKYADSLGKLGQRAVTLVVSEIPWSGQSCFMEHRDKANLFEYSIIPVCRHKDGSFSYDYRPMQRYIDVCAKHGIKDELSLYGLANVWTEKGFPTVAKDYPDNVRIRYYDESDGCFRFMREAKQIDDYIISLEHYFIRTNQIERVRLAADEPGDVEAYRKSLSHIALIAPSFKFKAAINHAEFIGEFGKQVYDFAPFIYCVYGEYDKIKEYKQTMKGKRFLWYVCCGPDTPNTFLRSDLTESYYIGIFTSFAGLDGFLRWNYTVWNDAPRQDIRYGTFPAGDINFVYPAANGAPLLTLRYKALRRGIEFYELLEKLKEKVPEALDTAFSYVMKKADIHEYNKELSRDEMFSVEYKDYADMRRFLLGKLAEK